MGSEFFRRMIIEQPRRVSIRHHFYGHGFGLVFGLKVVGNLAFGAERDRRQLAALLDSERLLKGEGVAFDGGGGMG